MATKKSENVRSIPAIDLGHTHARAFLDRFESGRVPSLLFTGPAGVGKELAALDFARHLCCQRDVACQLGGDDLCASCLQVSLLEHPGIQLIYPTPTQGTREGEDGDVTDIARVLEEKRVDFFARYQFPKKTSIRIARSRAVIQRAATRPFDSPYDIFIFVDAHTMREEAQNALLKLVEEPPAHVLLIFITSNPDAILYTIRSRCQRVRFAPLRTAVVERVLSDYYGADASTARRAATMSQGSILRGRDLMESFDDNERDAAAAFVTGLTREGRAWALGRALTMGKGANREAIAHFLDEVAIVFRDMMAGDSALYVNGDIAKDIDGLAESWERARIPGVIDRIAEARKQILIANAAVDAALADLFLDLKRAA